MEYRKLGTTDLNLSVITYGAWSIGGTFWGGNDKQDSIESIHASIDHGITSFDTAPIYGFGLSEELIGEAIKGKDRTKIQILDKFGLVWDRSNQQKGEYFFKVTENDKDIPVYKYASKGNVMKEVEESLKRLNTDYIDLLQLHWPDATTPIYETMEALEVLIQQGKIKAAGVSNYNLAQLKEAEAALHLASNQLPYSMLTRHIEKDIVPYTVENNIGIIAYSPLERGLLTGKYFKKEATLKTDDHRNDYFRYFNMEAVKTFLDTIEPLAKNKNASLSQLVLQWTIQQPGITIVLAGARNASQAIENARAINVQLSSEELLFISEELEKMTYSAIEE